MCDEQQIILYHYDELSEKKKRDVCSHLSHCQHCQQFLTSLTAVGELYQKLPTVKVRESISDSIQSTCRDALVSESLSHRPRSRLWKLALVAAAILILMVPHVIRQNALPSQSVLEWNTSLSADIATLKRKVGKISYKSKFSAARTKNRRAPISHDIQQIRTNIDDLQWRWRFSESSSLQRSLTNIRDRMSKLEKKIEYLE